MAGRRPAWKVRLEKRLWELLDDAPPRDGAPLARVLIDLHAADANPVRIKSRLDQLEERRKKRQQAASG